MKEYAAKSNPSFTEGTTFRTTIPLPNIKTEMINDTINDLINDTISERILERLIQAIKLLSAYPGLKINELTQKLAVFESTAKRDLKKIRALVEYKGSKKTGDYFLTEYMGKQMKVKQKQHIIDFTNSDEETGLYES